MQPEEAPAQLGPARLGQRPGEGRRDHQRPDLALGGDAAHRHRIAEREGAAIARRRDIDPGQLAPRREVLQVGAQPVRLGQEGQHRHHLPQGQQPQRRAARRHPPGAQQIGQDRDRQMRARGMADHQHLVHVVGQRGGDATRESGHPVLEIGRIGAARLRGMGIVMHQVIGEEPVVARPEPAQHRDQRQKRRGEREDRNDRVHGGTGDRQKPQGAADDPGGEEPGEGRDQQLHQQHPDRVERRDHRPLAQHEEPPQGAGGQIGPGGAQHLQIGRRDAVGHAGADKIGPDQHLDVALRLGALDLRAHLPAIGPTRRGGEELQRIARDRRLRRAFLAVKLAITARRDRIVAGDVEHPPAAHLPLSFGCLPAVHRCPRVGFQPIGVFRPG